MSDLPEVIINKYVWEQFRTLPYEFYYAYNDVMPFFPVEDIQSGDATWGDKPYVIWDSFMTGSGGQPFYPVKRSQLIYSIHGAITDVFEWRDFMLNILDRGDQTAIELNEFAGAYDLDSKSYFHTVSATQRDFVGRTSPSSESHKYYVADIIVNFKYHRTNLYNT